MTLHNIVAAADESAEGRAAVEAALTLAARTGARLTVMTVVAAGGPDLRVAEGDRRGRLLEEALERLTGWMGDHFREAAADAGQQVEYGVAYGVPSIEISRFAEDRNADLLVLGRKQRTQAARLLIGDTADAVARRSRVPCLFVPLGFGGFGRVLAAVDGTPRGFGVLLAASEFATAADAALSAVAVEATALPPRVLGLAALPTAPVAAPSGQREERLRSLLALPGAPTVDRLLVREGEIVGEILDAAQEVGADVLAVGYHRGGPPAVVEAGSTGRRLVHGARGAVLTVPL
ncbi:MAG TPA: universal stress protein [Gemmatimonadales bacterium]|nr:universal stress protein [Gemmatimonadales bacterium]